MLLLSGSFLLPIW